MVLGGRKGTHAVSRVHFHHKVVALSTMTEKGHVSMPLSVPKCLAKEIGVLPFVSYTSSDKIPGCDKGDYFPCPLEIATERLKGMQAITTNL